MKTISVAYQPIAAISHGAVIYGLSDLNKLEKNPSVISSKVLKYTYGIQFSSDWTKDVDSLNIDPDSPKSSGETHKFNLLVKRGIEVTSDQIFSFNFKPESGQTRVKFKVYSTDKDFATYINESEMKLLGVLNDDLPGKL